MRQSMGELQSIVDRGQSHSGGGRFTVRTIHVIEPSRHDASSVRAIRKSLNISQAVFAQLVGVSPALVRAWELGTRRPAPIARRLLDQMHQYRATFAPLIRIPDGRGGASKRARKVA
jgi:putative transcriptional regulator